MPVVASLAPAAPQALGTTTASADELIRSHVPLVGHLVREILGRLPSHVSRDELTSAGLLALVTSARGFDRSRGVPFARFATIRIRGALTDELRSMDWASRAVRGRARELTATRQQLTAALGRTPRREELAQVLGVAVGDLDALEADVQRASTLSVESLREDGGGDLLPSRADGPEGLLVRREQIGLLHDAIAELPDRLRTVVEQYFYGQRKMTDIAADLGVTESRVSQMRSQALAMLREGMRGQESELGPEPGGATVGSASVAAGAAGPASVAGGAAGSASAAGGAARRRDAARQAYVAAIAARSTLATRLAATTALGETRGSLEELRAAL